MLSALIVVNILLVGLLLWRVLELEKAVRAERTVADVAHAKVAEFTAKAAILKSGRALLRERLELKHASRTGQ